MIHVDAPEPRLVAQAEALTRLNIRRSRLAELLANGTIASVSLGTRRLIVAASLAEYVARQAARAAYDGRVRCPPGHESTE